VKTQFTAHIRKGSNMPKKVLRIPEIRRRLNVGNTTLYEEYINTGRLRMVRLGPRAVGATEDDVDALIDALPVRPPNPDAVGA
jgi:predicted DNA-binding transcriptional regulator AlpA